MAFAINFQILDIIAIGIIAFYSQMRVANEAFETSFMVIRIGFEWPDLEYGTKWIRDRRRMAAPEAQRSRRLRHLCEQ